MEPLSETPKSSSSGVFKIPKSAVSLLQANRELVEMHELEDGSIVRNSASRSVVRLWWESQPKCVLLIKKPGITRISSKALEICDWIKDKFEIRVLVEPAVKAEEEFCSRDFVESWESDAEFEAVKYDIDFIVCLGGDGTLLWANTLFEKSFPPVISFAMGTLGFLTAHSVDDYSFHLESVVRGGFYLTLRSRLVCKIYKSSSSDVTYAMDDAEEKDPEKPKNGVLIKTLVALNEITIDRGNSPYLGNLECFLDDNFMTVARADGLIVSTATGSTAYNLAAGGSLLHPDVPAILFTPVCPHSLSFRPLVFPDGSRILIKVSEAARGTAWITCDGKSRTELALGDYIEIYSSKYPLPAVCYNGETEDWFRAVRSGLQWNSRG
jgi:NAD+ kinase